MSRASAAVRLNIPLGEVRVEVGADPAALAEIHEGLARLARGEIDHYILRVGSHGRGQAAFVFRRVDLAPETSPIDNP